MSKQPRQSVRKKIRINEEKSIPAQVVPMPAQLGKGPLVRHSHYWEKKSSSMRTVMRPQSLLPEFLGEIHSLFCQNRYSYGVAGGWAVFRSPLLLTCLQTGMQVTWATAGSSAITPKEGVLRSLIIPCWSTNIRGSHSEAAFRYILFFISSF